SSDNVFPNLISGFMSFNEHICLRNSIRFPVNFLREKFQMCRWILFFDIIFCNSPHTTSSSTTVIQCLCHTGGYLKRDHLQRIIDEPLNESLHVVYNDPLLLHVQKNDE